MCGVLGHAYQRRTDFHPYHLVVLFTFLEPAWGCVLQLKAKEREVAALNSRAADLAGRMQKAKDDLAAATAALEASRRWAWLRTGVVYTAQVCSVFLRQGQPAAVL